MAQTTDLSESPGRPPALKALVLIILAVLLVSIIFYQVGAPQRIDRHLPIFNFDTFLYAQYAKAWADGHPYRFNEPDPPTTGCTSHLYPLLLSLFYRAGFTGIGLVDAAFVFNLLLLLLSTVVFWRICLRILPAHSLLATLIFIFNGQLMLGILGLSEAGLFLFFSLLTWFAALNRRYGLLGFCLFLLPFIRPEGIVIIAVYTIITGIRWITGRRGKTAAIEGRELAVTGVALLAVGLLFLLNSLLTGMIAFDSMINKGHFLNNQWLAGLDLWVRSLVKNFRTLLLGSGDTVRLFYMIPLASGVFILIGFFGLPWNKNGLLSSPGYLRLWWLVFIVLSLVMTSYNRAAMLHYDRYLVWVLPLLIPFLVNGVDRLSTGKTVKQGLLVIFLLYQLACLPVFLRHYANDCGRFRAILVEIQKTPEVIGSRGKVGVFAGSGIKYFHPQWHVINMGGVTTPYFRQTRSDAQEIKLVQYRPDLQFEHLIYFTGLSSHLAPPPRSTTTDSLVEKVLLPTDITFNLDRIDWKQMLVGIMPVREETRRIMKGKRLIDKLDIGYIGDTRRCRYDIYTGHGYTRPHAYLARITVQGVPLLDAAVGVLGGDRFTFNTIPGRRHWLVGRMLLSDRILLENLDGLTKLGINTRSVERLLLKIGDQAPVAVDLSPHITEDNLVEWWIPLPARFFRDTRTEFQLAGDHIPCDYWLYTDS